jgi:CheY-like chemotaxis protein
VALARRVVARLVRLDLRMPRMNGLRACEAIHQLPNYETVPIAILISMLAHDAAEATRRAGATAIFHKPIKPMTLLRGLAPFLGEASIPGRPVPAAGTADPVSADFDLPAGQVLQRVHAPPSAFDEPEEMSRGRRMLEVYRR